MTTRDDRRARVAAPPQIPRPVYRYLRGYAFDPTLSIDLSTARINEVLFALDWEERELEPGPAGEYIEVIDYDPSSKKFYPPVNLNHPYLLANDGLEPSEGNPQFHQQMVYAVAMTTIRNFEQALGRKVLWAPRLLNAGFEPPNSYVQRLRIYPHALRQANAYYSPQKKALLFGYFPANPSDRGAHLPGGTVFTCLSHDIVAHETTHALLDGMHRRFIEATNPDVRAFHEAFADIVALFQHFSFPAVLRHQLATTRGNLRDENLLGKIACQFGATTGRYGALRDAIGKVNRETGVWEAAKPDPRALEHELAPHDRGAILVAAVFDAFLSIYKSRVTDLLRIATGGTGVLPQGDLHPDLVNRLADEAAKAAGHVLQVCIRALDYLPLVDVTFGEYLRAIITADSDAVPLDERGYRVAFIEAFRRRGIYPRDVRSLAVESLRWRSVDEPQSVRAKFATIGQRLLQSFLQAPPPDEARAKELGWDKREDHTWNRNNRKMIFIETRRLRGELNLALQEAFTTPDDAREVFELTGLRLIGNDPVFEDKLYLKRQYRLARPFTEEDKERLKLGLPLTRQWSDDRKLTPDEVRAARIRFDVHILRQAQRVTPDGKLLRQFIIGIIQTRRDGFRGSCTLIIDADTYDLRYAIRKPVESETRPQRERQYRAYLDGGSTYSTYLGDPETSEPFALLHSDFGHE